MRRIGILVIALASVVAFSAMSVASASAKKVVILAQEEDALPNGTIIEDFSSNLITTSEAGNLECEESTITWELTANSLPKVLGANATDLESGNFEGKPGACKTSLGAATVTAGGYPWSVALLKNGKGEIKGTPKVKFTAKWLPGSAGYPVACTFEATKVKFTWNAPKSEEVPTKEVKLTVTKAKFKAPKGGVPLCPKKGELSGEFNMTAGGKPVEGILDNI